MLGLTQYMPKEKKPSLIHIYIIKYNTLLPLSYAPDPANPFYIAYIRQVNLTKNL